MQNLGFRFAFGVFALVVGAALVADVIFDIHLPLVRLVVALLLLAWGARFVTRSRERRATIGLHEEAWLADRRFAPSELPRDARFDVAGSGRGVVDL